MIIAWFSIVLKWLNENNGFIISILTFVYVCATLRILRANQKSAQAASTQLREMKQQRTDFNNSNKQQVALQLLDRRLKSYHALRDWMNRAQILNGNPPPGGTLKELFRSLVFRNIKDREMRAINEQIQHIMNQLSINTLSNTLRDDFQQQLTKLQQDAFFMKITLLDEDSLTIDQIDALFPMVNFDLIKQFKDAFLDSVVDGSDDKLECLKQKMIVLINENIPDRLWEELKRDITDITAVRL